MTYSINHYNGVLLGTVADSTINTTLASLNLIGHGFSGYGQSYNDNFVWLTENFCNTTPPSTPLTGQLWYDSGNSAIKFYNGSVFKPICPTISMTAPSSPLLGDEWFDTAHQQLNCYNGVAWVLVGPTWPVQATLTGMTTSNVGSAFFAGLNAHANLLVLASSQKVTTNAISGFGNIRPGLNFATASTANVAIGGIYNASNITVGNADQIAISIDPYNNGLIQTANNLILNNSLTISKNLTAGVINTTSGYQFNGAAPLNHILVGNGTDYVDSATVPSAAVNYQTVANIGVAANTRPILNFLAPLTVTDDPSNLSTDIGLPTLTTITPGFYQYANITVDAYGRITNAANTAMYYQTIANVSSAISPRSILVFQSPLAITDNALNNSTNVSLATTSVTPGFYQYVNITVDAYGRITNAANTAMYYQTVANNGNSFAARSILNILSPLSLTDNPGLNSTNLSLTTSGVTAGTYNYANITVDSYGRITNAISNIISSNLNTNGSVSLGGAILQWGQLATTSSGGTPITTNLPTAFPTACLWAVVIGRAVDGNYGESITFNIISWTKTSVTYQFNGGTSGAPMVLAIGY